MKVLIADEVSSEALDTLRSNHLDVEVRTGLSRAELMDVVGGYDVLVVRSGTKVDAGLIERAERLKVIGRAGIGIDNVDVDAATWKGVIVMNSPRGNALAAAEHTLALMFALARHVTSGDRSLKQGRWDKAALMGVEVSGKVLGIIGLGNVGRIVAEKGLALGMQVIVYDPYVTPDRVTVKGIEMTDLTSLLERADFVTVHVPLTGETRHLLNGPALAKVKKGVFIVNAARGGIVDEEALYDALERGVVAGAALDVFETEPPTAENRLVRSDKVIATPHLGGSTTEAQRKVAADIASQIVDYAQYGVIRNSVNTPAVSMETKRRIAPYTTLTGRLARFVSLVHEGPVDEIEIEYRGAIAEVETTLLTREILSLVLGGSAKGVNPVNAPVRARSMGIRTREFNEVVHYYPTSLLIIRLRGAKGESAVYGTLLQENEARLIRLNTVPVDADLTGKILLVSSPDRPGLIGKVAGRLAQAGINIGEMHFGREEKGGLSVTLFDVDQDVDDGTMEALRALEDVVTVKRIDLSV